MAAAEARFERVEGDLRDLRANVREANAKVSTVLVVLDAHTLAIEDLPRKPRMLELLHDKVEAIVQGAVQRSSDSTTKP